MPFFIVLLVCLLGRLDLLEYQNGISNIAVFSNLAGSTLSSATAYRVYV